MDKLTKYRFIIKAVLERHSHKDSVQRDEYEKQVIIDDEQGHYIVMGVGWNKSKRIHGISIHIDLKGDKIWIQQDWTEPGVAQELEDLGVPKSDIVLAFHAPNRRKYLEDYALF